MNAVDNAVDETVPSIVVGSALPDTRLTGHSLSKTKCSLSNLSSNQWKVWINFTNVLNLFINRKETLMKNDTFEWWCTLYSHIATGSCSRKSLFIEIVHPNWKSLYWNTVLNITAQLFQGTKQHAIARWIQTERGCNIHPPNRILRHEITGPNGKFLQSKLALRWIIIDVARAVTFAGYIRSMKLPWMLLSTDHLTTVWKISVLCMAKTSQTVFWVKKKRM